MCLNEYDSCTLCARKCRVNRNLQAGYCRQSSLIRVGRASLHHWEEPCISGTRGSGTVFFSGCTLRCCYCQNFNLSAGKEGVFVSEEKLADIFLNLQEQGAHNINLVTAEHFAPGVYNALCSAKKLGMKIPVILNSSGYLSDKVISILKDMIDIYLVDFKYMDTRLSSLYSAAPDYPQTVKRALEKIVSLKGNLIYDENDLMQSGTIVRHLCLPSHTQDSKNILEYVHKTYGEKIVLSIMSQYTPVGECNKFPELKKKLTRKEYDEIIDFCISIGIEDAFIQEGDAARESFIPSFDGSGVIS